MLKKNTYGVIPGLAAIRDTRRTVCLIGVRVDCWVIHALTFPGADPCAVSLLNHITLVPWLNSSPQTAHSLVYRNEARLSSVHSFSLSGSRAVTTS